MPEDDKARQDRKWAEVRTLLEQALTEAEGLAFSAGFEQGATAAAKRVEARKSAWAGNQQVVVEVCSALVDEIRGLKAPARTTAASWFPPPLVQDPSSVTAAT
jgi:hypothetical protein